MAKRRTFDLDGMERETRYVLEAADMRAQAVDCETGFKMIAKMATKLADRLDEHERQGVTAVKDRTGDLFEEMPAHEVEQQAERAELLQLQLAMRVALRIVRLQPDQIAEATGRMDGAFSGLRVMEEMRSAAG